MRRVEKYCSTALAAGLAIESCNFVDPPDNLGAVVADEAGRAVFHDLGGRTLFGRDHRCSTRHGLDHHKAEWFRPLNRIEERAGTSEKLELVVVVELAEILDLGPEERLDLFMRSMRARRVRAACRR